MRQRRVDSALLTLRETARLLGLSEARVYQLDAALHPTFVARGKKMRSRYYSPDTVAAYAARRLSERSLGRSSVDDTPSLPQEDKISSSSVTDPTASLGGTDSFTREGKAK